MITNAVYLHAAGSLAACLLVFTLYRQFRLQYALRWTLSFVALATFELASAYVIFATGTAPRGLLVLAAIGGGAAAYLQLGLMLWGSLEVSRRRPLKIRDSQRLISTVVITGVLAGTIPYLLGNDPLIHRYFPIALHALAAAFAFAACGAAFLKFRGAGFTLQAATFVAYGIAQAGEFLLVMRTLMDRQQPMPLMAIGIVELISTIVLALGIVLVLLEDQREAAATATSEVERLAYYDTITGMPNRALFADRLRVALSHAQRHRYKVAVIFIDLDRFKQVNDSLGHTMGDKLLKAVGQRIRNTVRDEDTLARFGGDEFAVLIHILPKMEDAGKIAKKILDALAVPVIVDNREFGVSASIGLSVYPVDGEDGETLIRNADTALNRAKEFGSNTYQYYAVAMNHRAVEALEIDSGLRRALARNEFTLHYQPLVDVASGGVFGLEALIRWNHPDLGLIAPDRFIPAAEQSGLIVEIGRWVLGEACKQAKEWHQRGHRVVMAVNLSARQFEDPDLPSQVADALSSADLPPRFLELEITEGYAMKDVEKAIETLHELKRLGVRIAIDDFGTGYSCFSYLKRFPIDTLKLDGSFVRDLSCEEDAQIALGVIALAHSLKLKVIAEGVETIGQLAFLREHACDRLQGYLFSRPIPPAQFESVMSQKTLFRMATASQAVH